MSSVCSGTPQWAEMMMTVTRKILWKMNKTTDLRQKAVASEVQGYWSVEYSDVFDEDFRRNIMEDITNVRDKWDLYNFDADVDLGEVSSDFTVATESHSEEGGVQDPHEFPHILSSSPLSSMEHGCHLGFNNRNLFTSNDIVSLTATLDDLVTRRQVCFKVLDEKSQAR